MSEPLPKITITARATRHSVPLEPPIDVVHLQIETVNPEGIWEESFGNEREFQVFWRGFQAGCSLLGGPHLAEPTIRDADEDENQLHLAFVPQKD